MEIFGVTTEPVLRLTAFAGIFAVMALLELLIPKRKLDHSKAHRWFTNLAIGGLDSALVRLMALFVIPLAAVAAALWAEREGWGMFNGTAWPAWLEMLVAIVLLDLAIYAQHVASHKIPILWRLHKMHHADVDFDVTTAIRFHPIEIGLSMLWKMLVVVALGADAVAVVLFEVILNGCAMFNHGNVDLPRWLDRSLRTFLVTPDMHRVHHSVYRSEHDTNYGFNLSVWDRLFGTYTAQPRDGHAGMTIGLTPYQSEAPTGLVWSLVLPFRGRRREGYEGQKKLSGK
jgi:sterol desaturase/sphingolipid hydroxylase (fatty acid hydroxylase superfamily)